jgi:hypothetical protein
MKIREQSPDIASRWDRLIPSRVCADDRRATPVSNSLAIVYGS